MLAKQAIAELSPPLLKWPSLIAPATGTVFGKPLHSWQEEVRKSLSISTNKPIIMVGHQPTFFHPGILAKFIAATRLRHKVDGVVVYLVVDHHHGDVGLVPTPKSDIRVATVDSSKPLKDQSRVHVEADFEPFSSALRVASGDSAAMQFANATVQLMSPWAKIDHVVTASELLHTEFGEEVISAIHEDKAECLESYNDGVKLYPESKIPLLHNDELPVKTIGDSYSPRALLLTLLARLVGCDLFIHGTGGMKYDRAMEYWCNRWLGVSPCGATMATATLRLPLACNKFTESRRSYHTPPFAVQTKQQYVRKIQQAPYKSPERQFLFEQMHRWLSSVQEPLDVVALKEEVAKALRRDWAFSLYADQQLLALQEAIV